MPHKSDKANENPYEPPSVEPTQSDKGKKTRTLTVSIGLGVAIFLASGVAFCATCTVGAIVGMRASPAVSEQAMGHGVMTGVTVGTISGLIVAALLTRTLFRRR